MPIKESDYPMNKRHIPLVLTLLILLLLGFGCGTGQSPASPMSMTLTPLSARVVETATARALDSNSSGNALATAIVKATERSQEIYATQTAFASLNDASRLATATVIAPAIAELPRYGLDPANGQVAWVQGPVDISLSGPNQTGFANDYQLITAGDFAMASDIKWNTKNSLSGCGFMFRSNGDQNKPSQYMVVISRAGNGQMAFLATKDGDLANFQVVYPRSQDRSFTPDNDGTNRLAVVARGPIIEVYTNGVLIGQIDTSKPPPPLSLPSKPVLPSGATPPQLAAYQNQLDEYNQMVDQTTAQLKAATAGFGKANSELQDGLLGFVGLNKSGQMTCTFDKAWLFQIER